MRNPMKILLFLAVALCTGLELCGGSLSINPLYPKKGNIVNISYSDDGKARSVTARLVEYSKSSAAAVLREFPLKKSSGKWIGEHKLSPATVYCLMSFVDDDGAIDNNGGLYWEAFVSEDYETLLENSRFRAATVRLGGQPEVARRQKNIDSALVLLSEELKAYPKNWQAALGELSLKVQMKKIVQNDYNAGVVRVVESASGRSLSDTAAVLQVLSALEENHVRAFADAFERMGNKAAGDALRGLWIQAHPGSEIHKEVSLKALRASKSADEFMVLVPDFLRLFSADEASGEIQRTAVTVLLQQGKIKEAALMLDTVKHPSPEALAIVFNYVASGADDVPMLVATMAERSYKGWDAIAEQAKPDSEPAADWMKKTSRYKAFAAKAYAIAQQEQGNMGTSITMWGNALSLLGVDATPADFLAAMDPAVSTGQYKVALDLLLNGLARAPQDSTLRAELALITEQLSKTKGDGGGAPESYEQDIASRHERWKQDKLVNDLLNLSAIDGVLTDAAGKKMSLSDLRGKVVFIDFWATWCGPCKRAFPAIQELYAEYADAKDVMFLAVNVWERVEDRVKVAGDFIESNKYTFPVMYDLSDEVVAAYGVTGIPTKFILDKKGAIRFKEVGVSPADQFKMHTREVIEYLRKNS